jgi:hypothetical protein
VKEGKLKVISAKELLTNIWKDHLIVWGYNYMKFFRIISPLSLFPD